MQGLYSPIRDGIARDARLVHYREMKPPESLSHLVHCYWELKTESRLEQDFELHAVPDACVNILFNELEPEVAGVTALRTTFEVLNLGREFHYVGIQFLPGVWRGNRQEIFDSYVGEAYRGSLPLIEVNRKLIGLDFRARERVMSRFVEELVSLDCVVPNPLTEKILRNIQDIQDVRNMAEAAGLSPRQLQRTLKRTTNFTPHDLLKVLRLQQSFKRHYLDFYSDQAHYIHSFRKITGYTPEKFKKKFDV
ncbi:MAG: AraC family transcriptional regulator [Spirochaetaceae bacterium]|nr:AraC family transcriptional regulator [Spirochaetaceae bacterium]